MKKYIVYDHVLDKVINDNCKTLEEAQHMRDFYSELDGEHLCILVLDSKTGKLSRA